MQGGYGALFAVMVQILLSAGAIAVQGLSEPVNYHGIGYLLGALAQCRGTIYFGARNISWCRILIVRRCASPGAKGITNLSWVQE